MLTKSQAKYIQSLGQKKFRDEAGMFIAEGPKIIDELLTLSPGNIHQLYALPVWVDANRDRIGKIETIVISERELQRLSFLATPNSVVAVVKKFDHPAAPQSAGLISLALDTIQDPGNFGTIIRIADWFGIPQVICNEACADLYNPKVVQSTMGSIGRVNVFYLDLSGWISKQAAVRIYAAALEGRDVSTMSKIQEGVIVIGNESKGISAPVLELANVKINIPRKGKAESLNAGVATGIILSHLV